MSFICRREWSTNRLSQPYIKTDWPPYRVWALFSTRVPENQEKPIDKNPFLGRINSKLSGLFTFEKLKTSFVYEVPEGILRS
jgi:hypothetical protein